MNPITSKIALFLAAATLAANGAALAQGKGHDKEKGKDRQTQGDTKGPPDGKEKKAKKQKHENGKNLVGDKVKKNGKHEFHKHGKNTASVDVLDGKIRGVSVRNADTGNVPVKKYKTNKKMADASTGGLMPVKLLLVQAQSLGETWIGYAYIDEWGDVVIYWFPYEMIYDGYTGAVEYVPIY